MSRCYWLSRFMSYVRFWLSHFTLSLGHTLQLGVRSSACNELLQRCVQRRKSKHCARKQKIIGLIWAWNCGASDSFIAVLAICHFLIGLTVKQTWLLYSVTRRSGTNILWYTPILPAIFWNFCFLQWFFSVSFVSFTFWTSLDIWWIPTISSISGRIAFGDFWLGLVMLEFSSFFNHGFTSLIMWNWIGGTDIWALVILVHLICSRYAILFHFYHGRTWSCDIYAKRRVMQHLIQQGNIVYTLGLFGSNS